MAAATGLSMYGRDEELSALIAFLNAVPDLPGALVLDGEAGVGKTSLFEAGLAMARGRSYRVIQARPTESEARLSFATLRDLLDPVFDDLADSLPPPQRRALSVALLRDSPGSVPERAGAIEAGFLTCLTECAADGPILVAIDDVQWLDRPSRRVLEYATRRLASMRLGLLQPALAHLWVTQWPIDFLAAIREWTDDLLGARVAFDEVIQLAEERGDEASREWTLVRLAHVECLTGAWTEALRHLDDGYAMTIQSGRKEFQAIYLAIRALVEAHLGRVEESRESAQGAFDLAAPGEAAVARREARRALGFLELSLGRQEDAHRHLGPLLAETLAAGIKEPGAMRFLADEIEALIGLGQYTAAEERLAWLEERAVRLDRPSALAGAARCRGLLLAARGETAGALGALRRALAEHDRVPMPFERARTLLTLGRVARRAKLKRVAREALAIFEGLGASIWAANAQAELGRVAGRPPSDGRLTPTERRVAELLAEGRSSKEVAAALFVTPKTVETYASRIYAKLGVHSRVALARQLALVDGDTSAKV